RRRLASPPRLHRLAEELDLPARVVEVVLLLHLVTGEAQQSRDRVAVGAVAGRADGDRAGRVRGDELDLDPLVRLREAAAVVGIGLPARLDEPAAREPEVEEARARDFGAIDPG